MVLKHSQTGHPMTNWAWVVRWSSHTIDFQDVYEGVGQPRLECVVYCEFLRLEVGKVAVLAKVLEHDGGGAMPRGSGGDDGARCDSHWS